MNPEDPVELDTAIEVLISVQKTIVDRLDELILSKQSTFANVDHIDYQIKQLTNSLKISLKEEIALKLKAVKDPTIRNRILNLFQ